MKIYKDTKEGRVPSNIADLVITLIREVTDGKTEENQEGFP